jgi:hypothetical protein
MQETKSRRFYRPWRDGHLSDNFPALRTGFFHRVPPGLLIRLHAHRGADTSYGTVDCWKFERTGAGLLLTPEPLTDNSFQPVASNVNTELA